MLSEDDLTILTGWAEAVAEAAAYAPERIAGILAEADGGRAWRAALGLPDPSVRLTKAFNLLKKRVRGLTPPGEAPTIEQLLKAASKARPGEREFERLVRRVLLATLEERRTRHNPRADD